VRYLSGTGFDLVDGALFENCIAAEMMKWIRTSGEKVSMSYYRTRSGLEIDFCLENQRGLTGVEVKYRDTVVEKDFTGLRRLAEAAGKDWHAGLVVYYGDAIKKFGQNLWAVPAYRLFG
jgi:predicted AAA+ superfamily ATPase